MPGKAGGPNLVRRVIDLPANSANPAFIAIFATGPTRGWRVRESIIAADGVTARVSQGYQIKIPNDNSARGFAVTFQRPAYSANIAPEDMGFENWNQISEHGPIGEGFAGAGNSQSAGIGATQPTVLCYVSSLTATVTSLEIVEYF